MDNKISKKTILILIFMIIGVIIAGTFAWLSFRSKDTAMVLTVGNINNVQVTVSPYQIKTKLSPKLTYEGQQEYTTITIVNNGNTPKSIILFYKINNIDDELKNSNFKYTMLKSTNGTSYSEYALGSGNFANASNNNNLDILEETVPANTTYYYKVYIWLYGQTNNQGNMQGKAFNGELNASIVDLEYNFNYTGNAQVFNVPKTGYYKIELWGAEGGGKTTYSYNGGLGGYTSGYINLTLSDTLYVYIGEYPTYYAGSCYSTNPNNSYNASEFGSCAGGGGATDIRTIRGAWNDSISLNSRIMVAGGGGGATYVGSGGAGGNLIATDGQGTGSNSSYYVGTGGSQITGNNFGISGKSTTIGGGGYYAGKGGTGGNAGGGSSFISGYAGVNAITEGNTSNPRSRTNNTLHYSGKYFINGEMQSGVNSGNGRAKITYIGTTMPRTNTNLNNVRYIKDCINGNSSDSRNRWNEVQAIYNGINVAKGLIPTTIDNQTLTGPAIITDGDIGLYSGANTDGHSTSQCIIIDLTQVYNLDEIGIWHNFNDHYKQTNNAVTYVSSDNNTWIEVINRQEEETSDGKRVSAWSE